MADAELGIVIKTTGAEEGAASLDKFSASAKGAAGATNDLAAAQDKARSSLGTGRLGTGLDTSTITKTESAIKSLGTATTATGQSLGFFRSIWQGMTQEFSKGLNISGGFGLFTAGAKAATSATKETAEVTRGLHDTLRLLSPVAAAAGVNIGGMYHFTQLARIGIEGLAIGISAILIAAIQKAADSLAVLKKNITDLQGGDPTKGAQYFSNIEKAAKASQGSVEGVFAAVSELDKLFADQKSGFISLDATNKGSAAITTLSQALQLSGKTATEAEKAVTSYVKELQKLDPATGKSLGLTQQLFDQIRKDSPGLANSLAQAFGRALDPNSIARFSQELAKTPKTLDQLIQALNRIGPAINQNFSSSIPTLSQAIERLKNQFSDLFADLGRSGGAASVFVTNFARGLDFIIDRLKAADFGSVWQAIAGTFKQAWDGMWNGAAQDVHRIIPSIISAFSGLWIQVTADAKNAVDRLWGLLPEGAKSALEEIKNAFNSAWSSISDSWNNVKNTIAESWNEIVSGGRTAIQQIGGFVSGIVQSVVSGITQMVNAALALLNQLRQRQAAPNAQSVNTGGFSQGPSFDASAIANQFDQGNSDFSAGFATGGAFTVSGTGGTDSVPVRFMATPGETVTITPPDLTKPNITNATTADIPTAQFGTGAAATQPAAIPVSAITTPITFAVKDSTGKIVGAVDSATQAIAALTTATNSAASATTAAVNNISTSVTRYAPTTTGFTVNTNLYSGKSGTAAGPLGAGPVDAYGNVVPSTVATYVARINRNASIAGSAPSQGVPVYAVNPNYQPMASGGTFIVPGAGGTDTVPVRFMATPGERVTVTTPEQSRVTVLSPTTTPATPDVSMTGTAIGAANKTVLGTTITSPITSTVKDTSSKIVSAVKDISTSVNNMATDVGNAVRASASTRTIFSGSSSTTSNSGPTIIAPPVPRVAGFVAGMASGGTFTVPGSGATDSVPIRFMATPGEQVSVTPTGTGANPSSAFGLQTALGHMDKAAQIAKTNLQQLVGQMVDTQRQGYEAMTQRYARGRPIVVNIVGAANPTAFINSESQIRRTVRRALG